LSLRAELLRENKSFNPGGECARIKGEQFAKAAESKHCPFGPHQCGFHTSPKRCWVKRVGGT